MALVRKRWWNIPATGFPHERETLNPYGRNIVHLYFICCGMKMKDDLSCKPWYCLTESSERKWSIRYVNTNCFPITSVYTCQNFAPSTRWVRLPKSGSTFQGCQGVPEVWTSRTESLCVPCTQLAMAPCLAWAKGWLGWMRGWSSGTPRGVLTWPSRWILHLENWPCLRRIYGGKEVM